MSETEDQADDDGGTGRGDPVAALQDLPAPLCEPLVRAVRKAADALPRSALPGPLRPLAGWHPQRLTDPRARRAIAVALQDARLREHVGAELDVEADEEEDVTRLTRRVGTADAVAVLAVAGRWDELAVLAADAAQARAQTGGTAAEPAAGDQTPPNDPQGDPAPAGLEVELRQLQARAVTEQRRAAAQQARAERAEEQVDGLRAALAEARSEQQRLEDELAALRRRYRSRVARLRQRVAEAEFRAGPADEQRRDVADRLEGLAEQLRASPGTPAGDPLEGSDERVGGPGEEAAAGGEPTVGLPGLEVPHDARAARAARPAVLPAGLSTAHPDGVRALLRAPGLTVVLDGYNVTKHPQGRPTAALDEQRRWLVSTVAATAARFHCRPVVVFDGADARPGDAPAARGVRVSFSLPSETADDHIVAIVAAFDADAPLAVVTSDRGLQQRLEPYAVNLVASEVFLAAQHG